MLLYLISESDAKEIAMHFLQQYHSTMKIEQPVMKEGVWVVEAMVLSPYTKKFQIKINPKTGHIIEY